MRIQPREALLLYVGVILLMLGLGSIFVLRLGLGGLALGEWTLVAAPSAMLAAARGGLAPNLGLRLPRARDALGAVLIGSTLWLVLSFIVLPIQESIAPTPPELSRQLAAVAMPDLPLAVTLLIVAVTPAICEELLCRGVIARAFVARLGTRGAIVVSAALFAALHLSVYRFVPTFLLGLSLGWVALRSDSIIPPMIVHALNNGSVVILSSLGPGPNAFLDTHSMVIGPIATVLLVGGHALVSLRSDPPR